MHRLWFTSPKILGHGPPEFQLPPSKKNPGYATDWICTRGVWSGGILDDTYSEAGYSSPLNRILSFKGDIASSATAWLRHCSPQSEPPKISNLNAAIFAPVAVSYIVAYTEAWPLTVLPTILKPTHTRSLNRIRTRKNLVLHENNLRINKRIDNARPSERLYERASTSYW
jgi:hypothetical protein